MKTTSTVKKITFTTEMEGFVSVVQKQLLQTKVMKAKVEKAQHENKYQTCEE